MLPATSPRTPAGGGCSQFRVRLCSVWWSRVVRSFGSGVTGRVGGTALLGRRCKSLSTGVRLSTDLVGGVPRRRAGREAGRMTGRLDVTGVLRRARRQADLSQRELARLAGVSRATIGRAERDGQATLPLIERVLAVAGLRLAVVDEQERPVAPMRADGVRDLGGRRMPAHLDPVACWGVGLTYRAGRPFPLPPGTASFARRDGRPPPTRDLAVRPDDHPSRDDLISARRRLRPHGPQRAPSVTVVECHCGPDCERRCVPTCDCQCEPSPDRLHASAPGPESPAAAEPRPAASTSDDAAGPPTGTTTPNASADPQAASMTREAGAGGRAGRRRVGRRGLDGFFRGIRQARRQRWEWGRRWFRWRLRQTATRTERLKRSDDGPRPGAG